jgi:thioredoxin-related protein
MNRFLLKYLKIPCIPVQKGGKGIYMGILIIPLIISSVSCKKNPSAEKAEERQTINAVVHTAEKGGYKKTNYYFSLLTLSGKKIDLALNANRPVLIMYFSPNCDYCADAVKILKFLDEKYKTKGLLTLAATGSYDYENAKLFADFTGLAFPVIMDEGEIYYFYGVRGVPHFFLLDKNHELAREWVGYSPVMGQIISQDIDKVI